MKVVVFSDIHANYFAVEQLASRLKRADAAWFLGDLVGRGPHFNEVLGFLREFSKGKKNKWVVGNHDAYVWDLLTDVIKGRIQGPVRKTLEFHVEFLKDRKDRLDDLMTEKKIGMQWVAKDKNTHYAIVHSTVDDPLGVEDGYMTPYISMTLLNNYLVEPFRQQAKKKKAKNAVLFTGHTHLPLMLNMPNGHGEIINMEEQIQYEKPIKLPDGITVINPGSLGNPKLGSNIYAVLDTKKRTLEYCTFRLTEEKMKELMDDMVVGKYPGTIQKVFREGEKTKLAAEKRKYYAYVEKRENGMHNGAGKE